MNTKEMRAYREFYNKKLSETDEFFRIFGSLDDKTYSEGAISKKNKELMGLAISILSRLMSVFVIILRAVLILEQVKMKL